MCKGTDKKKNACSVLTRSRKYCKPVVAQVTGHNLLPSHASHLGVINNDTCKKCREVGIRETLEYLPCIMSRSLAVQVTG